MQVQSRRESRGNENESKVLLDPNMTLPRKNAFMKVDLFINYLDFVMISPASLPLLNRVDPPVMSKKKKSFIHSIEKENL